MTKSHELGNAHPPGFQERSMFYSTLHDRVNHGLRPENRWGAGNSQKKAVILLSAYVANLFALINVSIPLAQVALFICWGVIHAGVGFNIFHDSIHGSFAKSHLGNRALAFLSCSMLGVSRFFWYQKHNVLHHRYSNVQGWDDDLETRGSLRVSPAQPWSVRYRFQHIYAPLIYALTTLEWIFIKDFIQYFTCRMNRYQSIPPMNKYDHMEFWASKAAYFLIVIALPLHVMPSGYFILGFASLHVTLSLTLASIFQLAHVTTLCTFPEPDSDSGMLNSDWAVHQMNTTADFSTRNRWLTWFSGGLNFQVEHHLFPRVSHVHYPMISKILVKTAKEFNVPYHSYPTYFGALSGHLQALKSLSVPA
jgi:linoleoyl-CoA desaturase